MIIDQICNARSYVGTVKNLEHALDFLEKKEELPLGRYEFDGGFVLSVEGNSVDISKKDFEAHRDYADVMWILRGKETASYCPIALLDTVKDYDKASDCSTHTGVQKDLIFTIPEGFFYVMLPGEGHKPCIHLEQESSFRKYILKCKQ